eukprot:m51a1_g4129 hypothetical protein (655) ;mRNA; f:187188-189504
MGCGASRARVAPAPTPAGTARHSSLKGTAPQDAPKDQERVPDSPHKCPPESPSPSGAQQKSEEAAQHGHKEEAKREGEERGGLVPKAGSIRRRSSSITGSEDLESIARCAAAASPKGPRIPNRIERLQRSLAAEAAAQEQAAAKQTEADKPDKESNASAVPAKIGERPKRPSSDALVLMKRPRKLNGLAASIEQDGSKELSPIKSVRFSNGPLNAGGFGKFPKMARGMSVDLEASPMSKSTSFKALPRKFSIARPGISLHDSGNFGQQLRPHSPPAPDDPEAEGRVLVAFQDINTDNSGFIAQADFRTAIRKLEVASGVSPVYTEEQLVEMLVEAGKMRPGFVHYSEFSPVATKALRAQQRAIRTFNRDAADTSVVFTAFSIGAEGFRGLFEKQLSDVDTEKTGFAPVSALRSLLHACPLTLTDSEVESVLHNASADLDGSLDYREWLRTACFPQLAPFTVQKLRRQLMRENEMASTVAQCLRSVDPGLGKPMSVAEAKSVLMSEDPLRLTEEEASQVIESYRAACPSAPSGDTAVQYPVFLQVAATKLHALLGDDTDARFSALVNKFCRTWDHVQRHSRKAVTAFASSDSCAPRLDDASVSRLDELVLSHATPEARALPPVVSGAVVTLALERTGPVPTLFEPGPNGSLLPPL